MNAQTDTHPTYLVLASQSPRRRELLALLGLPFEATAPAVAETPRVGELPDELVLRLSRAKAQAASGPSQGKRDEENAAVIVACDTVVSLNGIVLGKPRDGTEAATTLRRLRGRSHTVYSGVTLLQPVTGETVTALAVTRVTIRRYSEQELARYVASGDSMDKAGAYAIQNAAFHPVAALEGCFANVMGLPLCHLALGLQALGIEPPADVPAACQSHTRRRCTTHATILRKP